MTSAISTTKHYRKFTHRTPDPCSYESRGPIMATAPTVDDKPAHPLSRSAQDNSYNTITLVFMIVFHAGAIAALFFFHWKAVITAAVLYFVGINLGICIGYHRLLTHRGYKVPRLTLSGWAPVFVLLPGAKQILRFTQDDIENFRMGRLRLRRSGARLPSGRGLRGLPAGGRVFLHSGRGSWGCRGRCSGRRVAGTCRSRL
jgi:hypothetical protein